MQEITLVPVGETGTELADPRTLYVRPTAAQMMAKPVKEEDVALVLKNQPMPRVPRSHETPSNPAVVTEKLLDRIFPLFHSIFRETGSDESWKKYDAAISSSVQEHRRLGMSAQADAMTKSAGTYKAIRSLLISETDFLRPDSLIPIEYLPDLAMAVPVWYEWEEPGAVGSVRGAALPQRNSFYCNLVPGQRWTDTYLMFNYRGRTIADYEGDIIPPKLFKRMVKMAPFCERVVIMTPYHDKAGADWDSLAWQRNIDPYIIGFLKNVPFILVLGRFSDSGTFPLYSEMVADTMNFLRTNVTRLRGFNRGGGSIAWIENGSRRWRSNAGTKLERHTEEMFKAYEQGALFDWLRGAELKPAI